MHLIAIVDYENIVDASITELADALEHDRSSVSKALPVLEDLELIHRAPPRGTRPRRILLNPHLIFRGNVSQRKRMLKAGWPPVTDQAAPDAAQPSTATARRRPPKRRQQTPRRRSAIPPTPG